MNEKSDFMEVTKMMPTIGIMTIVFAALTIYLCHDEYKRDYEEKSVNKILL